MSEKHIKTVAELVTELSNEPQDAVVIRSEITYESPAVRSKIFYSQREATKAMLARRSGVG